MAAAVAAAASRPMPQDLAEQEVPAALQAAVAVALEAKKLPLSSAVLEGLAVLAEAVEAEAAAGMVELEVFPVLEALAAAAVELPVYRGAEL